MVTGTLLEAKFGLACKLKLLGFVKFYLLEFHQVLMGDDQGWSAPLVCFGLQDGGN